MFKLCYILFIPLIFAIDCEDLCRIMISLKENTPIEELQWNLKDYQRNTSIDYQYSLSNPSDYFEINSNYLKYRANDFDREKICSNNLINNICSFDLQIFTQHSLILLFQIIILDINDCQPQFEHEYIEFILRENLSNNYQVQLPIAQDFDSIEYNIDRYEFVNLTENIEQGIFQLEHFHNELHLKILQPFDCEKKRNYHLFIIAIDKGGWKSNVLHVHIIVGDLNEYQPKFLQRFYHTRIAENLLIINSTSIPILQVRAIDDDCDDQIMDYSIINNEISLENFPFSIEKSTGLIRVKQILDYETISIYRFRVRASNLDQITSSIVPVIIDILDINDNPPTIHVNILNEYLNQTRIQIKENLSLGQVIGTILIRDIDSILTNHQLSIKIHSCSLNCPIELDTDMFSSTTSLIRIARQLDSELFDREYSIILEARDNGQPSLKSEYHLNIDIVDINDCTPKFTQKNYRFHVLNTTVIDSFIGQIHAIDDDFSPEYRQIRYQFLDQEKDELIFIDSNNGSLFLKQFPSSIDTQWNRTILAIDQENPLLFDQTNIQIFFYYQQICLQKFNEDIYVFNTTEHQKIPYEIGQVNLNHCQTSSISVSYQLIHDESSSLPFNIDSITGKITAINELDREIRDVYEFFLQSFDNETNQYYQTKISIHILDENDHSPTFTSSLEQYIYISISHSPVFITNIQATDADFDRNSFIDYYFTDPEFYAYFHLYSNGSIVLYNSIHIQLPIRLEIFARDQGYPKALNSTEQVVIYLCDIFQRYQCFVNSFERRFFIVIVFLMIIVIGFSSIFILSIIWKLFFPNQWKRKGRRL